MKIQPRHKLLDLFCGGGGASRGYIDAGFAVMGIDHIRQPYYPTDSMGYICEDFRRKGPDWIREHFDAVHASPPCQAYSITRNMTKAANKHARLIEDTRELLLATGLPYVIENVPQAPLKRTFTLCGNTVGLPIIRHRIFESNVYMRPPPCLGHDQHYSFLETKHSVYRDAMECDWMSNAASREAIPPRYAKWIGVRLLEYLTQRDGAAR